ncbi:MAG: hypothetical protein QM648_04395 [Solirubrobacterales bacterium]
MPSFPQTSARIVLAILATLVLAAAFPALASAEGEAATPDTAPLKELPDLVLTPWLSSQTSNGNFKRPSGSLMIDGYANAGIAYAMLQEAARTGNEKYFKSAMKAFSWISRTRYPMNGVFYQMFSASAYNLARTKFASRSAFRKIRPAWANKLRRFPYQKGTLGSRYHYNKNLVEALEVVELYDTRLRGNASSAILKNRSLALKRALRVLGVLVPRRVDDYAVAVAGAQGWQFPTTIAEMSDPPDNPPAYNALVAGFYARAYSRLPAAKRTARMRQTAERMINGVVARVAPDGDIAFDGRSQEQAWSLSSAAYAAWNASQFETGAQRQTYLAFSRRVVSRLETVHVTSKSSFGFVLTPAAGCCDRQDMPPGQDHYYDVGKYSGLTALTMGWALTDRPADWAAGDSTLPTDSPSNLVYGLGRGRFYQHRGENIYWFLRMQSDYYDARSDMGVAVMKIRAADGTWIDAIPPRPYTGGHFKPADPASPCLVYLKGCAYLELHDGVPAAGGGYSFNAIWRTARGTRVRAGTAAATPTENGLVLTWASQPGDTYKLDTFIAGGRCRSGGGATAANVTVKITGESACALAKGYFAGGSLTTMRKVTLTATATGSVIQATYAGKTS